MKTPRVTIGLPVYQGERFVDEAIRSIREQTFTDLELVIADNGSTDETEQICRAHAAADPRVSYHRSPDNRGASWNYSRLVPLARGCYFKWAAHDDVLRPTFVGRCVEVLDADPDVVLVHTRAAAIDHQGEVVRHIAPNHNARAGRPSERFADIIFREQQCFPVFGLMRTEPLRTTGLLGPFNGHDYPLMAEMALHGRYAQVPEVLFLNRDHPERSIRKYRSYRERIAWFDPDLGNRMVFPHVRLAQEYARSISRAAPDAGEARGAHLALTRWSLMHLPKMGRDVAGAWRERLRQRLEDRQRSTSAAPSTPRP